jgi:hypothetical protein
MTIPLLKLMSDLVHDGKVQRAFVDDPHSLMDMYGLSVEEQNVLMRMDMGPIGEAIAKQLSAHTFSYPTIRWPGPHPEVRVFEPTSAVRGQQLQLHVRGEGFQRQAKLTLKHLCSSARIDARSTRVSGGYREAVLDAELMISPDAPVGEYVVIVTNHEGAVPLTSFFPFQVKA